MAFELIPLPYSGDALAPAISAGSIHLSMPSLFERVGGVILASMLSARSGPSALCIAPRICWLAP